MKIREHRGSLAVSMETVAEIEPTLGALASHVSAALDKWPAVTPERITVEKYGVGVDARIGWDTHIVIVAGYGPFGFTDGPLLPV